MSEYAKLANLKTGAVTWTVTVSPQGQFYADAPGMTQCTAGSYEALAEVCKVRASRARVKVSIPYAHLNSGRYSEGTATGIHGGNGNILVSENGKMHQVDSWTRSYCQPFSDADRDRWTEVCAQAQALDKERKEIERRYAFPGGFEKAVKDAVKAAARQPEDQAAGG